MSTLIPIVVYGQKQLFYYPKLDEVFRNALKLPDMPSVSELERNTSLIFTNTHFSEELARSLPPLVVPVGGAHCEDKSQKLTPVITLLFSLLVIYFGAHGTLTVFFVDFRNSKNSLIPATVSSMSASEVLPKFRWPHNNSRICSTLQWLEVRPSSCGNSKGIDTKKFRIMFLRQSGCHNKPF